MTEPAEPGPGAGRGGVRTLVRGLAALDAVAAAPDGIGVTEVATAVGIDKGTASRLLATLRQAGYVRQRADRRFELGSQVGWLARRYGTPDEGLRRIAGPHLAALRDETQETVHLAVREGSSVVYLAQEVPERSVRVQWAVGTRLPLYRTAMGRAIAADLSEQARRHLVATLADAARSAGDPFDADTFLAEADAARRRGWAAIDRHDEVTRIAAAITDADGEPGAALALSGPSYRMEPALADRARAVIACAAAISADLATPSR